MKKSDDVYRLQILDAVAKTERFVAGFDKNAFIGTEVVQSAVITEKTPNPFIINRAPFSPAGRRGLGPRLPEQSPY